MEETDAALARALKAGHPGARTALYDRYAPHMERLLVRILGFDPELEELFQEVFIQAIKCVGSLEDDHRIGPWMNTIAVYVARGAIRQRKRRKWLFFLDPVDLPEPEAAKTDYEARSAVERVYEVLDELNADHRIAFTLRYIEGLELTEVAEACRCSLATIKRRLSRARSRFLLLAKKEPELAEWILRGGGHA